MYLLYESLYGELLCECDSTSIIGLYESKEQAAQKAKELIQEDLKENYVLDDEYNDIDNGYARLFYNNQENWGCYYEIFVEKLELIKEVK